MTLHPRDASATETLVGDSRRLLGDRLLAAALYGEAATEAYRPQKSPLETVLLEDAVGPGPFRAKAIGEGSISAVAPAIANAVADACGVRILDLPITAEKVYFALKAKGQRS